MYGLMDVSSWKFLYRRCSDCSCGGFLTSMLMLMVSVNFHPCLVVITSRCVFSSSCWLQDSLLKQCTFIQVFKSAWLGWAGLDPSLTKYKYKYKCCHSNIAPHMLCNFYKIYQLYPAFPQHFPTSSSARKDFPS